MLFQKHTGRFVELKRCDYVNDLEYYTAILRTKGVQIKANSEPDTRVLKALKKKIVAPNTNANSANSANTNRHFRKKH